MVSNIPISFDALNNDYGEDLKEFLQNNGVEPNEKNFQIQEINFCYDITELLEIDNKK